MVRRKNGSVSQGSDTAAQYNTLKGKWSGGEGSSSGIRASWGVVDGHLLYTLICMVTARKGAVLAGVDRQGYGYTLAVFIGGEKVLNKWYRPEAEGIEILHTDIEAFLTDLQSIVETS